MYVTVEVQRYFETLAESGNKVPMTCSSWTLTTEETLFSQNGHCSWNTRYFVMHEVFKHEQKQQQCAEHPNA